MRFPGPTPTVCGGRRWRLRLTTSVGRLSGLPSGVVNASGALGRRGGLFAQQHRAVVARPEQPQHLVDLKSAVAIEQQCRIAHG
jgi:hypothetical protein